MKSLLCAAGFHHDNTDAFGGYYAECSRCGRPCREGPTSVFRGSVASVFGVAMIFDSLMWASRPGNEIFGLACGGLLFVLGLVMIWRRW
jgi:hypothetical protein